MQRRRIRPGLGPTQSAKRRTEKAPQALVILAIGHDSRALYLYPAIIIIEA